MSIAAADHTLQTPSRGFQSRPGGGGQHVTHADCGRVSGNDPGRLHRGRDLYAIHHGSPGLLNGWFAPPNFIPAPGNWLAWRAGANGNDVFYNEGAKNVNKMGGLMGTHFANGTTFAGNYWGARKAFGEKFDIQGYLMSPYYTPNLTRVGQAGMQRGAIIIAVGYYQILGYVLGYPVVARAGGHVMTLSRARRLGNSCRAWTRDPADDLAACVLQLCGPCPGNTLTTQDNFRDRAYTVVDGWVLYAQPGFPLHFRWVSAFLGPGAATGKGADPRQLPQAGDVVGCLYRR
jgi:hypothetical protein